MKSHRAQESTLQSPHDFELLMIYQSPSSELQCTCHRQGRSDLRPSVTFKERALLTQEILLHQSMMDISAGKAHMWVDI